MNKALQIKLAVDMILTSMLLFSDLPMIYKIGIGFVAFDYSMLCSKRIEEEQNKEKQK
jgi:hypothetical protein